MWLNAGSSERLCHHAERPPEHVCKLFGLLEVAAFRLHDDVIDEFAHAHRGFASHAAGEYRAA
jgi:hypothetical protein